jgi:hypothetical protein
VAVIRLAELADLGASQSGARIGAGWSPAHELARKVRVDEELGTIVWPNGADMDPDVLHGDFEPAETPAPAHASHPKS